MSTRLQVHAGLSPRERVGARVGGLFEQHGRMVLTVCRLVLRDREEAEDAAQQTFLSAHRGLLAGTEPQDPAAWLASIARNECRRRQRAPLAVVQPLDGDERSPDGDPQQAFSRSEEVELLRQALAELPTSQRQAVTGSGRFGARRGFSCCPTVCATRSPRPFPASAPGRALRRPEA